MLKNKSNAKTRHILTAVLVFLLFAATIPVALYRHGHK